MPIDAHVRARGWPSAPAQERACSGNRLQRQSPEPSLRRPERRLLPGSFAGPASASGRAAGPGTLADRRQLWCSVAGRTGSAGGASDAGGACGPAASSS
mmetsp:Transcript_113419/g.352281  ORF Transcript_113419/g.352281 Transcript_113419/m.352281 type:complete len:99 (-) Transcript_113419:1228-1524(-)